MVIPLPNARKGRRARQAGMLATELVVSISLLVFVLIPVGLSLGMERQLARRYYHRAVAAEIVDGEMEILAAGEWKSFPAGARIYPVHAAAATNLPPGKFMFTRDDPWLKLEWIPDSPRGLSTVQREARIPSPANPEDAR